MKIMRADLGINRIWAYSVFEQTPAGPNPCGKDVIGEPDAAKRAEIEKIRGLSGRLRAIRHLMDLWKHLRKSEESPGRIAVEKYHDHLPLFPDFRERVRQFGGGVDGFDKAIADILRSTGAGDPPLSRFRRPRHQAIQQGSFYILLS